MPRVPYDEFSMFRENAEEWSIPYAAPPEVERISIPVAPSRHVSALRWGTASPRLVLLHGIGQNAHTFDTVALALGLPLLAVDLPGHGHSDAAPGGNGDVAGHARDVTAMLGALGLARVALVGMSLGGLVALAVAAGAPEVADRVALVDVTPGVRSEQARHVAAFVGGAASFDDLESLVASTRRFAPHRSESAIRRGVLHNAIQRDDGTWVWRHQRFGQPATPAGLDPGPLWSALESLGVPLLLVRGMRPDSVVDDDQERELRRRRPDAVVVHVADAGHSVQGDQPLALADALRSFVAPTPPPRSDEAG